MTTIAITVPADAEHNWRLRGNCQAVDPDSMHPEDADKWGEAAAKKVCAGCPVAADCLTEALRLRDWHGIRAGLTGPERRNLAEQRGTRRCTRCNSLYVPRLDTQVRCRPCARRADGNRTPKAVTA